MGETPSLTERWSRWLTHWRMRKGNHEQRDIEVFSKQGASGLLKHFQAKQAGLLRGFKGASHPKSPAFFEHWKWTNLGFVYDFSGYLNACAKRIMVSFQKMNFNKARVIHGAWAKRPAWKKVGHYIWHICAYAEVTLSNEVLKSSLNEGLRGFSCIFKQKKRCFHGALHFRSPVFSFIEKRQTQALFYFGGLF